MTRTRHPNKAIEAALAELESLGWKVEKAKGRSTHAWGFARCPENAKKTAAMACFAKTRSGAYQAIRLAMLVSLFAKHVAV